MSWPILPKPRTPTVDYDEDVSESLRGREGREGGTYSLESVAAEKEGRPGHRRPFAICDRSDSLRILVSHDQRPGKEKERTSPARREAIRTSIAPISAVASVRASGATTVVSLCSSRERRKTH